MANLFNKRSHEGNHDYVKNLVDNLGGVNKLRKGNDEFHKVIIRLDQEHAGLMEKYPDKWVAMGKDGVIAVGDSMEEVFAEVESAGLSGSEFEVEFLDSEPPDLIL